VNGQSFNNVPTSGGICFTNSTCNPAQPFNLDQDSYTSCCTNFSFGGFFAPEITDVLDFGCYTCSGKYICI